MPLDLSAFFRTCYAGCAWVFCLSVYKRCLSFCLCACVRARARPLSQLPSTRDLAGVKKGTSSIYTRALADDVDSGRDKLQV